MPRLYSFILLLFTLLFLSTQLKANRVIVKGQINSFGTGLPIANKKVKISVSSFTGSALCSVTHEKITNSTGGYNDTLECANADITKVQVSVEDCNGQLITKVETVPSSKVVELNFPICYTITATPPTNCEAVFSYEQISGPFSIRLNSSTSHGVSTNDNIIKRRWQFGDGKILEGNEISPAHVYDHAGKYEVCLTVNTAAGCEKTVCKVIEVVTPPTNCEAAFSSEQISGPFSIRLNSSTSHGVSTNDNIIKRRWQFGDGKFLEGNEISPAHTYERAGKYEVCLIINTAAGCEKTVCKIIEVVAPTNCEAVFSYEQISGPFSIRVNSLTSHGVSTNDNIIKRRWQFGDGKVLEGNEISPAHAYEHAGKYEVCLTINTAAGCEKTVCKMVEVVASTNCEAVFSYEQISGPFSIRLNSSTSHSVSTNDNIIKRRWKFGDGKVLEGNEVNPAHAYEHAGKYEVCLTINTAVGCEKTVCKTVEVVASTNCEAVFSYEQISGPFSIRLNSSTSHSISTNDNIIKRRWKFGDGKFLEGNEVSPAHAYEHAGKYEVCLTINTAVGCEKTVCKMVEVVAPAATCKADFSLAATGKTIKLNSINSQSSPGDIISRTWQFGDGKVLEGNIKDPSHEYINAGTYEVCLTIKTNAGCESRQCKSVVIVAATQPTAQCAAKFSYETLSSKKIRFNSGSSLPNSNSSIIERKWDFGDGTQLGGNEINPAKEYAHPGIYTVCLQIRTADKCESRVCTVIHIEEGSTTQSTSNDYIKTISLHPNPATTPLTTEIWSLNNNVNAELSIYDVYGVKKWSTTKVLLHGNNITVIPTSHLATGPYFFKVSSMYGVQSKSFYKL